MTAAPIPRRAGRNLGPRLLASLLAVDLVFLAASLAAPQDARRAVPPDLLQKARDKGHVRVIVELGAVRAVPEGQLGSQAAVASQRARIGSDQVALRAALRGLGHRVREFKTVPYVGLEVDYDTLRFLDSLPGLATRVREDVLLEPMLAQSAPLIKAPEAWNAGWDGSGQVIAIVDPASTSTFPSSPAR